MTTETTFGDILQSWGTVKGSTRLAILDCVLELAQQSITDILLFVKENVYLKAS